MSVCDLALSVPDARFGYPEVRRGLVAAMVMPHLLRHIGERTARWLLLTGELIDGISALRYGLINQITMLTVVLTGAAASRADGRRAPARGWQQPDRDRSARCHAPPSARRSGRSGCACASSTGSKTPPFAVRYRLYTARQAPISLMRSRRG